MNEIKFKSIKTKAKKIVFGTGKKDGLLFKIINYGILIIFAFIFLYPLIYMLSLSFKNIDDLFDSSVIWVPSKLFIDNYKTAIKVLDLPNSFKDFFIFNTLYRTVVTVGIPSIFGTISTCLIGYGFARFNFPFKKILLAGVILTFIIPSQIILLPQFVWFHHKLHILGTLWSYILPASTGQGLNAAVFILIFYSFYSMIPKSLDEAAYLDGANELEVFYHVGLKLSSQTILIVFLFNFVWYWNDYYRAAYYLTGSKWITLPLQLAKFENAYKVLQESSEIQMVNLNEPLVMAGTVLTIIPLLLIYFIMQRYFVESIDRTGITGE